MTIFRITYLDKYDGEHTVELPAETEESAIRTLEELLDERVTVKTIDELDES
jgi:hypothetical protein